MPTFIKKAKKVFTEAGEAFKSLTLDAFKKNVGVYHEQNGNFFIPKGKIMAWLYDNEEAIQKLSRNEYDLVAFPPGRSAAMAFHSSPLQDIWKPGKRKGHKELMALVDGWVYEENGLKVLRIDMMSTRAAYKGNGLMKGLIESLQADFPDHLLAFEDLTEQGHAFVLHTFPEAYHVWSKACTWRPKGYVPRPLPELEIV